MLSFFHQAYFTRETAKGENMKNLTVRDMADIAIVAAIYVVLTITPPLNAISYGAYQFRISEMMNFLAFYNPNISSVWRLVVWLLISLALVW